MVQDYAKRIRSNSGSNRKGKPKAPKSRASMTLKDLIDVGVILPGRNTISVSYKGINYVASLGKDGVIVYQGGHLTLATHCGYNLSRHTRCCWQAGRASMVLFALITLCMWADIVPSVSVTCCVVMLVLATSAICNNVSSTCQFVEYTISLSSLAGS